MFYVDAELCERWRCSKMKLWRMRRDGKLNSIRPGDCGQWLTSEDEVRRIEAPPDIRKPAPSVGAEEGRSKDGLAGSQTKSENSEACPREQEPAAVMHLNGGGR